MRRCSSCGNYFESPSGICNICGASNINPYEEIDTSFNKVKKRKKVKKIKPRVSVFKLFGIIALAGIVFMLVLNWNKIFPKYGSNNYVSIGNNQIPSIIAYTGKLQGVFGKKSKSNARFETLTLNFPAESITQRDIDRYQSNLKALKLFSDGYYENSYAMCGMAREQGHIITIQFKGGNNNQFSILYTLKPGSLAECTYGETIRSGHSIVGYYNRPKTCNITKNTENTLICHDQTAVVTIIGYKDTSYKSYENVINQKYSHVEKQKVGGLFRDVYSSKISLDSDYEHEAVLITYYDIQNRIYVHDYIIYYTELGRLHSMTIQSSLKNNQYFNLINSYSPDANPLK